METRREREIRDFFDIALVLKAATGAVEIAAAFVIAFVPRTLVARVADLSTAGELGEDPHDFMANHIRTIAHAYALHAHDLLALLLTLDGAIKIVLVALVFRGYRFAFPLFIVFIILLGSYEAYRAVLTGSIALYAIVLLDIALVFLAAHEYRRRYMRA